MISTHCILVVEDNEDDIYFMRRTLKMVAPKVPIRFVMDGRAALLYLRGMDRSLIGRRTRFHWFFWI